MDWLAVALENMPDVDNIANWIGIVTAFPIALTFYEVWFGRARRHNTWFQEMRRSNGDRPAVLIVDILPGKEIRTQVERYLQSSEELKALPKERIIHIDASQIGVSGAELSHADMTAFARKIGEAGAELYKSGADVIHYFHSGPLPTVAMVGAALANGPRVQIYHWRQGAYEPWGPLRHVPVH